MEHEEYESDDSALRAAIAASLRESRPASGDLEGTCRGNAVDLTGDTDDEVIAVYPKSKSVIGSETSRAESETHEEFEEDEDLKRAIAMSLQGSKENPQDVSTTASPSSTGSQTEEPLNSRPLITGLGGLDRKKMEEERLARLGKRKAEDPILVDEPETKHLKTETPRSHPSTTGNKVLDSKPTSSNSVLDTRIPKQPNSTPSPTPSMQFTTGTVKKTFAFGCPRLGDDIKIEEVFQKSDLELAVLSSFMWDTEWLFSKLDTRKTRFIMIMQAKDDATKRQYESETAAMSNLRLCFPPMDGQVNCMHSKLMLLFHTRYLRIAVPTANLVPYDWGEMGGVMENSIFVIDLPKRDQGTNQGPNTNFYHDLVYFLKASTLHENIISKLEGFDFSKTEGLAFVHTIGGSHTGDSWRRTGYCGLGRSVETLGLKVSKPINLDFVTSSIGSLNEEFMRCMYLASQGDDGTTELAIRAAKSFPVKNPYDPKRLIQRNTIDEWKERFRVYFPSQDTVKNSKGGPNSAGTVCFQSKWYEGSKFPRQVVRDCESQRQGLLMHNKILYVQPDEPIPLLDNTQCRAWAYVGSANLSESAWGRLVHDRNTKKPKLNCRNWECGVVIPVIHQKQDTPSRAEHSQAKSENSLPDIFSNTVPIPMRLPGAHYNASRKPWYFLEEDG